MYVQVNEYIASTFLNKKLHFKCDCLFGIDVTGICEKYEINKNEIILYLASENRLVPIPLNTPKLYIEIL